MVGVHIPGSKGEAIRKFNDQQDDAEREAVTWYASQLRIQNPAWSWSKCIMIAERKDASESRCKT